MFKPNSFFYRNSSKIKTGTSPRDQNQAFQAHSLQIILWGIFHVRAQQHYWAAKESCPYIYIYIYIYIYRHTHTHLSVQYALLVGCYLFLNNNWSLNVFFSFITLMPTFSNCLKEIFNDPLKDNFGIKNKLRTIAHFKMKWFSAL